LISASDSFAKPVVDSLTVPTALVVGVYGSLPYCSTKNRAGVRVVESVRKAGKVLMLLTRPCSTDKAALRKRQKKRIQLDARVICWIRARSALRDST
jgi:hypothetical protein